MRAHNRIITITTTSQSESEFTQDDHVQSITWYYVYELRYEHVTIGVHKSKETNMEAKVVCLVNLIRTSN